MNTNNQKKAPRLRRSMGNRFGHLQHSDDTGRCSPEGVRGPHMSPSTCRAWAHMFRTCDMQADYTTGRVNKTKHSKIMQHFTLLRPGCFACCRQVSCHRQQRQHARNDVNSRLTSASSPDPSASSTLRNSALSLLCRGIAGPCRQDRHMRSRKSGERVTRVLKKDKMAKTTHAPH